MKLGFIGSETGPASPNFAGTGKACQARVDAQNAKGGVNGRKIEVTALDDGATGNLNAAKDLVQNRQVFVVVNNSSFGDRLLPVHLETPGSR